MHESSGTRPSRSCLIASVSHLRSLISDHRCSTRGLIILVVCISLHLTLYKHTASGHVLGVAGLRLRKSQHHHGNSLKSRPRGGINADCCQPTGSNRYYSGLLWHNFREKMTKLLYQMFRGRRGSVESEQRRKSQATCGSGTRAQPGMQDKPN